MNKGKSVRKSETQSHGSKTLVADQCYDRRAAQKSLVFVCSEIELGRVIMRTRIKLPKTLALLLTLIMIYLLMPLEYLKASSPSYTFTDTTSTSQVASNEVEISGNHMVWLASDKSGNKQVYYKNLITGEEKQITDIASPKQSPTITETSNGDIVIIWTDKHNRDVSKRDWDLYAYNLKSGIVTKLNSTDGQYVRPSVSGNIVVWHDPLSYKMYAYDLVKDQETYLGEGRYPVVADQKIVYQIGGEGGLNLFNLTSKETKKILDLPYGEYANWFTFNGRYVLVMQGSIRGEVSYRSIDTSNLSKAPIDLTPVTKPNKTYIYMTIGNNYAAWLEDRNGIAQIIGAHLELGNSFQMTHGTNDQMLYSFSGDQLIMKAENGNLLYRAIIPVYPTVTYSPIKQKSVEKWIGPEGGIVQIETGQAILELPKDIFKEKTLVSIEQNDNVIAQSEKNLKEEQKFMSSAWEINAGSPFSQKSKLTLTYDQNKIIPQQAQKLGIYLYESKNANWRYIGGRVDTAKGAVEAHISEPGNYAVMIYDKKFSDINGHWASQTIEILASRWIVNGTSETQYSPNMQLTRAQFAKMLGAAMGLEPIKPKTATFTDVSTSHWGYEWIEATAQAGWVQGDKGRFHPDDVLTREQMMTMMIRAIGQESDALSLTEAELTALLNFKDANKISKWARSYVALSVKYGFILGANGEVLPIDSSTRAQAAVVTHRLLVYLEEL